MAPCLQSGGVAVVYSTIATMADYYYYNDMAFFGHIRLRAEEQGQAPSLPPKLLASANHD